MLSHGRNTIRYIQQTPIGHAVGRGHQANDWTALMHTNQIKHQQKYSEGEKHFDSTQSAVKFLIQGGSLHDLKWLGTSDTSNCKSSTDQSEFEMSKYKQSHK